MGPSAQFRLADVSPLLQWAHSTPSAQDASGRSYYTFGLKVGKCIYTYVLIIYMYVYIHMHGALGLAPGQTLPRFWDKYKGIRPGDQLVRVEGREVAGMDGQAMGWEFLETPGMRMG